MFHMWYHGGPGVGCLWVGCGLGGCVGAALWSGVCTDWGCFVVWCVHGLGAPLVPEQLQHWPVYGINC